MYHRGESDWLPGWAERPLEDWLELGSDSGQHTNILKRGTLWYSLSSSDPSRCHDLCVSPELQGGQQYNVSCDSQEGRIVGEWGLGWQRGKMALKWSRGFFPLPLSQGKSREGGEAPAKSYFTWECKNEHGRAEGLVLTEVPQELSVCCLLT